MTMAKAKILTLGVFDGSGRSGVLADLEIFNALGVVGLGAVAGIAAMRAEGEYAVQTVGPDLAASQLEGALGNLGADAVLLSQVDSPATIAAIAAVLEKHSVPMVLRPVFHDRAGNPLLSDEAEEAFRDRLVPRTSLLIVNAAAARDLVGFPVADRVDMRRVARTLGHLGASAVLVTGGHLNEPSGDMLWHQGEDRWLHLPAWETPWAMGKGAALGAAAAAFIGQGMHLDEAAEEAKRFLHRVMGGTQVPGGDDQPPRPEGRIL